MTAKVGYNVDSFGHNGMPQILKKSGMDSYIFMRPMPSEGLPGRLFLWESSDGEPGYLLPHSVRIFVLGQGFGHVSRCMTELKDPHNEIMVFYGVGNHGGGPTKENIESIRRLNDDESFPELVFSTPNQYFAEMERLEVPLPVVHDDLQHHASGCYAAHSGIKQWNRQAENKLSGAEMVALAERLLGQPYPRLRNRLEERIVQPVP